MKNILKRVLSLAVALTVLLGITVVAKPSVASANGNSEVRYTQKIMAVVFDNSGSMKDGHRISAAKYSLSLLMSMLNEKDEMYIVPMNAAFSSNIQVDLAASDRNAVLEDIDSNFLLNNFSGGTPSRSVSNAVSLLETKGLKSNGDAEINADENNKEYWLMILTDGLFEDVNDSEYQANIIKNAIEDYPSLHTVYVSFGSGAMDLSDRAQLDSFPFYTPYYQVPETPTENEEDLVEVLQKVTNLITGRYPLSDSQFSVNGSTLTIDLSQIPFSISSLSIVAQNCGAKVKSVEYKNGLTEGDPKVANEKICLIKPGSDLQISNGCAFTTTCDGYLYGGTLTYTFDGPISIDKLSIYAQPILDISAYMEATIGGEYKRVTAREINENLGVGEKICVGYEVFEQVNNTVIDLQKVFGSVSTSVVYGGEQYDIGEKIPLKEGSNQLTVEISLMDGAFTLRKTETLIVEKDPSFFRIEAAGDTVISGSNPKTEAIFTVYLNNSPATAADLANHTCNAVATASDGTVLFEKLVQPSADGKITVPYKIETNKFDVYSISLTVTTPDNISRTAVHSVTYTPSSLDLTVDGENHLTLTQNELWDNTKGFTFVLTTNGQPFPIANGITEYTLRVGDADVTQSATVSGNSLIFVPTKDNIGAAYANPADYEVTLSLTSSSMPNLNASATAKLTVEKTVFSIIPIESGSKDIDRFKIGESNAVLYYSFKKDDTLFTEQELKSALENGEIGFEKDSMFSFFLSPADIKVCVETVSSTPVIAVYAVQDAGKYINWHSSAFIFKGGDKPIKLNYMDASATDSFNVIPSSVFQHVLRITVLLLEIAFIVYVIIWGLGFAFAKTLPRGVFIKISSSGEYRLSYVNERFTKVLFWHLGRFITPTRIWKNQDPIGQSPSCSGMNFGHGRKKNIVMSPKDSAANSIFPVQVTPYNPIWAEVISRFHSAISNGHQFMLKRELSDVGATVEKVLVREFPPVPIEPRASSTMDSEVYYAHFSKSGSNEVLTYAVCFKKLL